MFGALSLALAPTFLARAQTTGSNALVIPLRVVAPRTIAAATSGATPLGIEVSPLETIPPNAFVRIKGLPQGTSLSEGYAVAPGTWAVALKSLPLLRANFPSMPAGQTEIGVHLMSVEGIVLAETHLTLVYAAAQPAAAPPPPQPQPPPREVQAAPRPPELSVEERQKAERLTAQGMRFLESGNIAVARQYFQRAADAGLADGAMRLAETFDPAELDRIAAQGVVPQPAEAKYWYEKALALGARGAKDRLARLANTN